MVNKKSEYLFLFSFSIFMSNNVKELCVMNDICTAVIIDPLLPFPYRKMDPEMTLSFINRKDSFDKLRKKAANFWINSKNEKQKIEDIISLIYDELEFLKISCCKKRKFKTHILFFLKLANYDSGVVVKSCTMYDIQSNGSIFKYFDNNLIIFDFQIYQ